VRQYINRFIFELMQRAQHHDDSKLEEPELSIFDQYTPKLADLEYGSKEYKKSLEKMQAALEHHYQENRHHPEHHIQYVCNGCFKTFPNMPTTRCDMCGYSQSQEEQIGIDGMDLVDILEMLCDWKAATLRHKSGDIMESLKINKERFKISDQLYKILVNTIEGRGMKYK
jgi:hypothetical protein